MRHGELLSGVLDKSAFGATEFGLVHCVFELLGGAATGQLLTQLGRLLTGYQTMHGFTCGIADLLLTPATDGYTPGQGGVAAIVVEEEVDDSTDPDCELPGDPCDATCASRKNIRAGCARETLRALRASLPRTLRSGFG